MIEGKPGIIGAMLIELDCILDTRAGLLAQLGTDVLAKAIDAGYHDRVSDVFPGISRQEFAQAYEKRNVGTLARSTISPSISIIKDFVTKHHKLNSASPFQVDPRIEVNFYPYDVPESVREMILNAITVSCGIKLDIIAVSYAPEALSFDFVRHAFDHIVMYDPGVWLEAQTKDFKRAIPHVTIMLPMLNRSDEEKTMDQMLSGTVEIASACEPLFNMVFMPVVFFCSAVLNPKLINTSSQPEGQDEGTNEVVVTEAKPAPPQDDGEDFGLTLL